MPFEVPEALESLATTVALVVIVDPEPQLLGFLTSTLTQVAVELPLTVEALLAPDTEVTLSPELAHSRVVLLLDFRSELRVRLLRIEGVDDCLHLLDLVLVLLLFVLLH